MDVSCVRFRVCLEVVSGSRTDGWPDGHTSLVAHSLEFRVWLEVVSFSRTEGHTGGRQTTLDRSFVRVSRWFGGFQSFEGKQAGGWTDG